MFDDVAGIVYLPLNIGTTALYFDWSRAPTRALDHAKSSGSEAFYLATLEGSLLPGETREVMWTFKSATAGMYLDKWQGQLHPHCHVIG